MRLLLELELVRWAKDAGGLRTDFMLDGFVLAMMADDGIRARSRRCGWPHRAGSPR